MKPTELVPLLETADSTELAVVRALLEDAGIASVVRNEAAQDFFGLGRLGTGFQPVLGPMRLEVNASDVERARELLAAAGSGATDED